MLPRALLVLLFCLNLATLMWWAWPSAPVRVSEPLLPAGVQTLRALPPPGHRGAARPVLKNAGAATAPAVQAPCVSFGPFADATSTQAALVQLRQAGLPVTPRQRQAATRGYRVELPPQGSPEAAAAAAERIRAAGITDLFVIRDGESATGVALGRFGSQASAERRVAELTTKGVEARVVPIGSGPVRFWLEVPLAIAQAEVWRTRLGAASAPAVACGAASSGAPAGIGP